MTDYDYAVLPAPTRGAKVKGLKTAADRYAHALAALINAQAREGWHYVRAEVLPSEERSGLTSRANVYHNLLIFRRPRLGTVDAEPPPAQTALLAPPPPPAAPAQLSTPTPLPGAEDAPAGSSVLSDPQAMPFRSQPPALTDADVRAAAADAPRAS